MTNKRIPQLDALTGAGSASDDSIVIFDTSVDTTKRIVRSELAKGIVSELPYTPSGNISASTVPTAIAEIDSQLSASSGSSLVGFLQSGTGASARTVQAKLRDTVSPIDFGAVGDGVADDTTAWQNAINSGAKVIDGSGKTYVISSEMVGVANQTIRNATFSATGLSSGRKYVIKWVGSDGTPQTLASNYSAGVSQMTVPNGAAFTPDSWCYVGSTEKWAADGTTFGELLHIKSVVGNVVSFYNMTLLDYTTAKSATITPISIVKNVNLIDVSATGPTTGDQGAFYFGRCADIQLRNVDTTSFDYAHFVFTRSANVGVYGCSSNRTGTYTGLDYGVAIADACYNVVIDSYTGSNMRSIMAIGGTSGITRHTTIVNSYAYGTQDLAIDAHTAAHEVSIINNTVFFSTLDYGNGDGIYVNATAPTVIGNRIHNPFRHGITWEPATYTTLTDPISGVFSDNTVIYKTTAAPVGYGLAVTTTTGTADAGYTFAPVSGVSVSNQQTKSGLANVWVQANASAINNICISNAVCLDGMGNRAIFIYAAASSIDNVSITGGVHRLGDYAASASSTGVIDIAGTSGNLITNWSVTGAVLERYSGVGTLGYYIQYAENGTETGTVFDSTITQRYDFGAGVSKYAFDYRSASIVTVTDTGRTIAEDDYSIIANRAAGTVTLTLPAASTADGRELLVKTIQAQAVASASSNVIPLAGGAAGTAIVSNTAGRWARLRSNGTNWVIVEGVV